VANAVIAALLAMGAARFIAVGDVLHQRSSHDVTDQRVGRLELFTRLLRDGQWWSGRPGGRRRIRATGGGTGLGAVLFLWALSTGSTAQPNTAA
jgi:hypothetical protein